ncbi:MAG: transposase [Paracoccaceae bacterium]
MLTIRDRLTGDLFDRWSDMNPKRRALLERSWAGVFREHLLDELPVHELAKGLTVRVGRPSKDLHVVLGALILQQMFDLTDKAAVEALAFNLAWHYALDIRKVRATVICEKTLRNYRAQVVESGWTRCFSRLTDKLIASFDVDTSRQRIDPTALRSAMRNLTRLGVVVETISKFVRLCAPASRSAWSGRAGSSVATWIVRAKDACQHHAQHFPAQIV